MDGWAGWLDECLYGWMDGWMAWVGGWMHAWMDRRADWMDGWMGGMINHSGRKECPSRGATPEAQGEDWNGVHARAGVALGTWEECLGPSRGSSCQYRACSRETNTRRTFGL
jgi:hypothetical protein